MLKLQRPRFAYFDGQVRPWEDAVLHISSEAVVRGLNVFEGLKGYWQPDGSFGIVAVPRHHARLKQSASLLHIPFDMPLGEFEEACHTLAEALYEPDRNMWIRATLYVTEGHWGEGTVSDLVLTAYHQPVGRNPDVDVGISTWQRGADNSLPSRIKTSTNYQVARLAKIEGRSRGLAEMILLNQWGRVAEAIGSCVLIVRNGAVITPPAWEGALESITTQIAEQLCRTEGISFERRPVDRTELHIADEIGLCGTLVEITCASSIEGRPLGRSPILATIARRYDEAVRGIAVHSSVDLSCRNGPYHARATLHAAE